MIGIGTESGLGETLAALASGRADPAVALFIDSVLALRGLHGAMGEEVAGALLERETPTEMEAASLDHVLARLDDGARLAPAVPPVRTSRYPEIIRLPAALRQVALDAEANSGWSYAGRGIRSLKLALDGPVEAEILRIGAGAATPMHTHGGNEFTLCLVGGFSDSRGAYGPGDISAADPGVTHRPVADSDGPCLVLAITDAGPRFKGFLGVLQKLSGR
ncbi:MAG: ChrR family anti-sigma-E factor [Alphaproteobacteria bacterium]|nr:ChrR family anti-sigma-E factor [Alphaproteobacteria bacterium]